ncbi:MAG: Hsp20/alpha crystallin family protein [Candidatus Cryptobacteroides sp.]
MMPVMKSQNWLPELFNDLFDFDYVAPQYRRTSSTPAINVIERESEYEVEIAAPGMTKDDFKVNLTPDNELVISLEKKTENKNCEEKEGCGKAKKGQYLRREFSYTSFRQSFTLPEDIEAEKISAAMENGVLKIELPKKEVKKEVPTTRNIEIR